jgi:hypothetical protein
MMKEWGKITTVGLVLAAIAALLVGAFFFSSYSLRNEVFTAAQTYENPTASVVNIEVTPPPFVVTHIKTPDPVKALYMTSWVAGRKDLRENLIKLIDETELNAIVIDIKDYTGMISFDVEDEKLAEFGSVERRVADMKEFIGTLHEKGIYVIGRISCFQDSFLVKTHPEWAVKTGDGSAVWKDYKGVSWVDAGAKPVWDYLVAIGNESYAIGFDELNFDYIRFPSDGNMKDISYTYSQGKVKSEVLKEFFAYLEQAFRPKGITISADLFGMTTTNSDDLGIGQILEYALAHFDYVAPMVYPSHYPTNFMGFKTPAEHPYEVIEYTMKKGMDKAIAASTTPHKLRPWLQDFSIGRTDYTSEMVRDQIEATYSVGLTSWMMWNASNRYTASAFLPASSTVSKNLQN